MRIKNISFISIIFVFLMASSCSFSLKESGNISFSVSAGRANSVNNGSVVYNVQLEDHNKRIIFNSDFSTNFIEINDIRIGNYLLKISCKIEDVFYYGETNISVEPGKNTDVKIDLKWKIIGDNLFEQIPGGIKVTVPQFPNAVKCNVYRYKIIDNSWEMFELSDLKHEPSFLDFFIEPNEKYKYQIVYQDEQWNDIGIKEYFVTSPDSTMGPIKLDVKPVASFNSETNIMTFSTMPKLNMGMEQLIKNNNGTFDFVLQYYDETERNRPIYGIIDEAEKNMEWAMIGDFFDQPLKLKCFTCAIAYGNTNYIASLDFNSCEGLNSVKNITVKDTRLPAPVLTQVEGGVKIAIPQELIDKNPVQIMIKRRLKNQKGWGDYSIFLDTTKTSQKEVIDKYAVPGTEYEYWISGEDVDYKEVGKTKNSTITAPASALGKMNFKTKPKATYDSSTGIMSFDPNPEFIIPTPTAPNVVGFEVWYKDNETGKYFSGNCCVNKDRPFTGMKWKDIISSMPGYENFTTVNLTRTHCDFFISEGGVYFEQDYNNDEVESLFVEIPASITVTH